MLLHKAADAGAEIDHGAAVRSIDRLADGDVAVTTSRGEQLAARWLIDASGQSTVVGKHLGLRKMLPHLKKIAFFGHFDHVWRHPGPRGGSPTIVMCDEGWFWLIPLDETRMSIGLVMHLDVARQVGLPNDEMLFWGISRSAVLRERTAHAVFPKELHVAADFSYRCEPFAGPGYFLAGDAATFVDPIFSTGVCLGMMGGSEAGTLVDDLIAGRTTPAAARKRYIRTITVGSSAFFRMVYLYYDHSFRELFLGGGSPMKIHNAVLSVLAGNVFPDVPFTLKWRLWMLSLLVKVHRFFPLATRHKVFSLRTAQPLPLPQLAAARAGSPAASPASPEAPLPGAA
jgi:flavin-dependent dehydrogenase